MLKSNYFTFILFHARRSGGLRKEYYSLLFYLFPSCLAVQVDRSIKQSLMFKWSKVCRTLRARSSEPGTDVEQPTWTQRRLLSGRIAMQSIRCGLLLHVAQSVVTIVSPTEAMNRPRCRLGRLPVLENYIWTNKVQLTLSMLQKMSLYR